MDQSKKYSLPIRQSQGYAKRKASNEYNNRISPMNTKKKLKPKNKQFIGTTISFEDDWEVSSSSPSSPLIDECDLSSSAPEPIVFPLLSHFFSCLTSLSSSHFSCRLVLCIVVGMLLAFFSRSFIHALDEELSLFVSNRTDSHLNVRGFEQKVQVFEKDLQRFHLTRAKNLSDVLASDVPSAGGNRPSLEAQVNHTKVSPSSRDYVEYKLLRHKVEELTESAESLRAQIQASSRRQVERKFGAGKHWVEIELAFPPYNDDETGAPNTFVIEMAPLDTMPHSVHIFLEMVAAGLLDGCSFILNALHILKAAPLPYDGSSAADKAMSFMELGLESVSYKEYNESFPHVQHTVGFAADGSPGFYISTEDNTDIYMGDPCFGKIVSGFSAIKRMSDSPTRSGIWLEKRIGIKSARIL